MGDLTLADLSVGDRVEMAAHTDQWMSGDRYAKVEGVGTKLVTVRFERSGRSSRLHPVVFERKANPFQPLEDPRSLVEVLGDETDAIEEPMEYVFQPGDSCYFEGDNIVHDQRCGTYAPGTLTSRVTGEVVGKKEI